MPASIPIQNLYYLLCYSWNRLAEGEIVDVSSLDSTNQADLFALVLSRGTRHLLRRGLERGYRTHSETIPGVRGRIDLSTTATKALAPQGRIHCEFDELTIDTLPNQIIRSTLWHLAKVKGLDKDLRKQLLTLYQELEGIQSPPLKKQLFRTVQLHSNARFYRFILSICEIVANCLLIDQQSGSYLFRDCIRDEQQMARVYEDFLSNFYRIERPDLSVKKEKITWQAHADDPANLAYLPTMETDISIRKGRKTLIMDAKYYKETLTSHFGAERVRSSNLYQLFAYLKNIEARDGVDQELEGMLLYPAVQQKVRLDYQIHDHRVRICTVDLAADWKDIHDELLELVAEI